MRKWTPSLPALVARIAFILSSFISSDASAEDASLRAMLLGRWTDQTQTAAGGGTQTINITSLDLATGQLRGKFLTAPGPNQKEEELVGWVSSAPPMEKADNAIVITFSVCLHAYGSITSYSGLVRGKQIVASWHNVRPNAGYEWAHIATGQDTWAKSE